MNRDIAETKTQEEIIKLLFEEKQEAEKRRKELQGKMTDTGTIYLPGEKEALMSDTMKIFTLYPERKVDTDLAQMHFRYL